MRMSLSNNQRIHAVMVGILLLLLAGILSFGFADSADAASTKTGIVTAASLYVRSGPGTQYGVTGYVSLNDEVTILDEVSDTNGGKWYYISYKSGSKGYSSASYIEIRNDAVYENDEEFENLLSSEGFPNSYKQYLRQLHAKYPQWSFKAAHTGLSWSDVIAKESKLGTSLVASSSPESWKSKAQGAYDADTGKYIVYDSGGWVCASDGIIKYYMDPRNFLNQAGIFQFLTHSYDANTQSERGLSDLLAGTFMAGELADEPGTTYAEVLMQAGAQADVNPYVLASMILVEQGSGGIGGSISGTVSGYEGYYNYLNIGAYRQGSMDAVTRGLWYASQEGVYGRPWDSIRKAIVGGAQFYGINYVQNNKNTLYFKKWNVMNGADSVGKGQYMTNVQGAESEAAALRNGYLSVLDTAMTFLISVYENMPSKACAKPTREETPSATESEKPEKKPQTITTRYTNYTRRETDKGFNLSAKTSGDGELSYISDAPEVAAVDESGQVRVVGAGTAKITVKASETDNYAAAQKVCTLTVKTMTEEDTVAQIQKYSLGLAKTEIIDLKAETTNKRVKLSWKKSASGFAVDYYQIWRSAKKSSGYKKLYTTSDSKKLYYINTKEVSPNTAYWYKVRGVRIVCGKTLYTPFTKIQVKTKE